MYKFCIFGSLIVNSPTVDTVGENIIATTKLRKIMVPSNNSFCNIELFSIAPCKVITLNPFCILFGISSLLLLRATTFAIANLEER